jgi:hypothetical protein
MVAQDAIQAPMEIVGGLQSEHGLLPFEIDAPAVRGDQKLTGMFRASAGRSPTQL